MSHIAAKHKKFAKLLAQGATQAMAYSEVYPKNSTPAQSGYHLAQRPDVKHEVEKILLSDKRLSLSNVIKKTADAMDAKKEVILGNELVKVSDNPTQTEARRDVLKLHGIAGFVPAGAYVDNRQQVISIGNEDVDKLSAILEDLKKLEFTTSQEVEQDGEIIDVTAS